MSSVDQQQSPYDWHQSEPDVWTRTCLGFEGSASFNQNIAHGHTELSGSATFRLHHPKSSRIAGTELELDELVTRARQAWIQARYLRPEVAVEMDRHTNPAVPQTFRYRVLRDEASLRQWLEHTFVVIRLGEPDAGSLDEVCEHTYNRSLATEGKQSMLYLVLPRLGDETDRNAHIIWNVAHAVTDGGSIAEFFNVWLQCLVDAAAVTGHDSIYTPTAKELDVLPRLPRSIVAAYRQQLKPTPHDEANAVRAAQANGQLISDKMSESLALTLVPTWNKREHSTVCLVKTMPAKEARQLLNFAKSIKTGVTYLASAATIMATAETFPERKASSSGALMGMVRNARRWVSSTAEQSEFGNTIPLGSDAVFLWIPVNTSGSLEPSYARMPELISMARHIRYELDQHLVNPHCISAFPAVAGAAVAGLTQQWSQIEAANKATPVPSEAQLSEIIGAQAPGFSSIGVFQCHPRFEPRSAAARESGLWIERVDVNHTGRQVNASPWISMLTIDGRIKFQLGFDTKFHDTDKMQQFMDRTFSWLQLCAASAASSSSIDAPVAARL